jgi:hypothetical protein
MTKKENALVETKSDLLPDYLREELATTEVTGFENVGREDQAIAILRVLQSNSPVLMDHPECKAGHIFNAATNESHAELVMTPIGFVGCYVEYIPRDQGGGFAGRHSKDSGIRNTATQEGNKLYLPNGNELVETAEHMVIVWPENEPPYLALFPLSSTQIKYSRQWNTDIGRRAKAMYVTKYKISTAVEKNNKGSWYSLKNIDFVGFVTPEELALTKQAAVDYQTSLEKATSSYANATETAVVDVAATMA